MVGSIKNRIAAFEDLAVQSKSSSKIMSIVPPSPGFSATKRLGERYRPKETSGFVQPVLSKPEDSMQNKTAAEKWQMMVNSKSNRDQQFTADLNVYQTYKAEKKAKTDAAETEEEREGNGNDQAVEESRPAETEPLSPVKTIQVSDDSPRENVEDRDELSISPLSFQGYQVESKHVPEGTAQQQAEPIQEEELKPENAEVGTCNEGIEKNDDSAQVISIHEENDFKSKETIDFIGQSSGSNENGLGPFLEEKGLGSKSSDSESSSYFMLDPNTGNIADVSVASEDDPFSDDFDEIRQELQATALEHKARSNTYSMPYSGPLQYTNEEEQVSARAQEAPTDTLENGEQYNLLGSNGESSGSTNGVLVDDEESSFTDYLNDLRPVPSRLDKALDEGSTNEEDLSIPVIRSMGSASSKSNDMSYSSNSAEGARERQPHKRPISHALSDQVREREMMSDAAYDRSDYNNENIDRRINDVKNQGEDIDSPVDYPEEDFREDDYDEEVIQNVYYKQDANVHSNGNGHQVGIILQQHEDDEGSDEEEFTSFQTANALSSEEEDSERGGPIRHKEDSIEHHTFLGLKEEDLDGADETTADDESDLIGVDIEDESVVSNTQDRNGNYASTKIRLHSTNDDDDPDMLLEHDMNDYMAQPIQLAPINECEIPDFLSDTYDVQPMHDTANPLPQQSAPSASDLNMQSGTTSPTINNGVIYDKLQHEDSLSQITDASFDAEPARNEWPLVEEQQQQRRNETVSDNSLMTYSTMGNSSNGIMQSKPDDTPIFRQRNSLHENKKIFGESNPVITNTQSNVSEITDPMGGMKRRPAYPKVHKRKNNEEVVVLSTISGPMKMPNNNTKPARGRSPSRFSRKNSNRTNASKESYVSNASASSFDDRRGREGKLKKNNSRFSIRSLSPFRRNSSKSNKSNGNSLGTSKEKPYRGPMSQIEASRINRPPTPTDILREDEHRETSIPLVAVASSDDSSLDKRRKPKKKFSLRSLSPFRRRKGKRNSRKADPFDEDDSI